MLFKDASNGVVQWTDDWNKINNKPDDSGGVKYDTNSSGVAGSEAERIANAEKE